MVAGCGTVTTSAPPPAIGGNGGCASVSVNTSHLPGATNTPATPQGTNEGGPTKTRTSENRRSNKPIMEKRRRARINNCLNELKTLILDAMKKDPARHSKLEKADILEMTVKHLEALQRQQVAMSAATDPNVANKFRAGFTECAGEVGRFPGLDGSIKRRLLQHLANCLNSTSPSTTTTTESTAMPTNPPLQVHILRTPVQNETPTVQQTNSSNIILANTNGQGVQLVPTRLPNGDIALILPSSTSLKTPRGMVSSTPSSSPAPSACSSTSSSPLPMLVPIPNRTNENSPSPVALERLYVNPLPSRQITILASQNPQRILIPHTTKDNNVSLLTAVPFQYNESNENIENILRRRVIIPELFAKSEKLLKNYNETPVVYSVESPIVKTKIDETSDNISYYEGRGGKSPVDESLYDQNGPIMSNNSSVINDENSPRYYSEKVFGSEQETLLHIPEREYYEIEPQSISPRSDVGYFESLVQHKYTNYYSDHLDRPYSPEMQKPLALVTKKKCEEYESEERPWRPW